MKAIEGELVLFQGPETDPRNEALAGQIFVWLTTKRENTRRTYRAAVETWGEFLGGDAGAWLSADYKHVLAFINWLRKRPGLVPKSRARALTAGAVPNTGINDNTVAKYVATLRSLYGCLLYEKLVERNPFASPRLPRLDKGRDQRRPTRAIPESKIPALLDAPDGRKLSGIRDRAALALLLSIGLRISELLGLDMGDIWNEDGLTVVRIRCPKGREDRYTPLPTWAAERLNAWLTIRRRQSESPDEPLFSTRQGRLEPSALRAKFRVYCYKIGLEGGYSPHSCRATVITHLLGQGVPACHVQMTSGHSSIQMVERYNKARLTLRENPSLGVVWGQSKK